MKMYCMVYTRPAWVDHSIYDNCHCPETPEIQNLRILPESQVSSSRASPFPSELWLALAVWRSEEVASTEVAGCRVFRASAHSLPPPSPTTHLFRSPLPLPALDNLRCCTNTITPIASRVCSQPVTLQNEFTLTH